MRSAGERGGWEGRAQGQRFFQPWAVEQGRGPAGTLEHSVPSQEVRFRRGELSTCRLLGVTAQVTTEKQPAYLPTW